MLKNIILLFLINYSFASNGDSYNDYCVNDSNCTDGYNCVSVETKNINLLPDISISQCIKEPICSGNNFGNCPDFSKWPSPHNDINSKCVFSFINGCNTTAECYKNNIGNAYGIYKCIDTNTIVMLINLYDINNKNDERNNTFDEYNKTLIPNTDIPFQTINNKTNIPASCENNIILNIICIIINFIILIYLFL